MTRRNVPRVRRAIARLSAVLIGLTACWGLQPTPATAAVQATFYASPNGSGTTCTQAAPCTLAQAKSTVRSLTPTMSGDLVVELAGGTYDLSSTLTFDASDSGGNSGHDVIYRAKAGENVVLSGGKTITGWSETDATKHIWKATLPVGLDNTRQLWVNDQRADLASAAASSVFGTMTKTSTGFTFTGAGTTSWTHPETASVVYSPAGYPWTHAVCPVSSVSATAVTVKDPCYADAYNNSHWLGVNTPTAVENNKALLSSPGQFAIDPVAKEIYYIPRSGQVMSTAKAVAGKLGSLVNLAGTQASPVQHIQFANLGFKYATWLLDDYGVVDLQANVRFTKYAADRNSTSATFGPDNVGLLPANVTCHSCQNVSFSGNTFEHLGGSGLGFDGGGKNNSVTGNVITDVSGNGVQIGAGDVYTQPATIESDYTVKNNYVHNVANEYIGGVGILATWVKGTHIEHNDVFNVPYTGISLGWGWGLNASSTMVDNHVDNNHIHNVQTSALRDGGAIYVLGTQGSSPRSTINGNYLEQDSQDYASLYLDNGSSYWDVKNNVVGGYTPHWAFVQNGSPIAHDIVVQNNYIGSDAGSSHNSTVPDTRSDPNSTNQASLTTWPTAALNNISNAGLEPAYVGLMNGLVQTNLAYKTTATSSTNWSTNFSASNANDESGASASLWSSATVDANAYWQTDLGASHTLSGVQILFRQDGYDYPTERKNFEVWVSNTSDMSVKTVACTVGGTPLANKSTYNCPLPAGSWRYVRVAKTDGTSFALEEVRVYGAENNVAQGKTATASTTWSPSFPASNVVDGNSGTIFASQNNGATQWWQVDLSQRYTLSQAQIVFRQDGYDYPTERKNFEVWVSNTSDMSVKTVACTVGGTSLPYKSTYSCALPAGPWQYVKVTKTDGTAIVMAEVRLFGH